MLLVLFPHGESRSASGIGLVGVSRLSGHETGVCRSAVYCDYSVVAGNDVELSGFQKHYRNFNGITVTIMLGACFKGS